MKIRIDRASSAWLIRKFVDPEAEFLFAPRRSHGPCRSGRRNPYHIPDAELGQGGGQTAFDKIIAKYTIDAPGLSMMADIVRAADRKVAEPTEGAGVAAMSHGLPLDLPDEEVMKLQVPMWEALYAFCQSKAKELCPQISCHTNASPHHPHHD
ncbi:MAG: chromate resistance protein [Caldilineaceae bacterium]